MGFLGSLDEDGGSSRAGFGIPCRKPTAAEPPNAARRGCAAAILWFYVIVRDPNAIIEL